MQCSEAQSRVTLFLDNMLTMEEKNELVQHIRSCPGCREELEFYYAVYDTIGKFDDQMLSGDYAAHVEDLLCQTEKERQSALKISRWRRFRLLTGCFVLAVAMSLGVRGTLIGSGLVQMAAETMYDVDGTVLPGRLELTRGIMQQTGQEKQFQEGQQMRGLLRQNMYERDAVIMHVMKQDAVLEYMLPEPLMSGAVLSREGLEKRMAVTASAETMKLESIDGQCVIKLSPVKR